MRHRNYHGCIDSVFLKKYSEVSKWNDRNLVRDYFSFSHFYINNKDDIDKLWILSLLVEKIDTEFWEKYSDAKSEIPIAESLVEEPEPAISLTELFRNMAFEMSQRNQGTASMIEGLLSELVAKLQVEATQLSNVNNGVNTKLEDLKSDVLSLRVRQESILGVLDDLVDVKNDEPQSKEAQSELPAQSRMVGLKPTFTEGDVKFNDVHKSKKFKSSHDIHVTKSELNLGISRFQNVLWFNLMTSIEVSSKFAYKNIDRVFDIFNIPGSDTYQYMRTELQASDCRKCLHRYTQDSPYLSHGTILEKLPTPFIDAMDKYIILN